MEATIKIAVVFIFLIILIRKKMFVEWAMLLGCVVLGLLFIFPPAVQDAINSGSVLPVSNSLKYFLNEIFIGAVASDTLLLIGMVFTITVLGSFMEFSGHMRKLMESLSELIKDSRYVIATAPSLIGLMPMPGGALFSCPMVNDVGSKINVEPTRMAAINFWFRHVWEYVWPLYPGLILMSAIFSVDIPTIMLAQIPLAIGTILVGLVFLIFPIKKPQANGARHSNSENFREIFFALWPLVIIIVFTMVPFPNHETLGIEKDTLTRSKLLLGLILSTTMYGIFNRINWKSTLDILIICLKKHTVMVALSIMLFKHLVQITGAADEMAPYFAEMGLPPVIIIFLLCFIVGLLTGLTVGYVGICFPIIAPIVQVNGVTDLGLMQFAFATGFIGVMLTPVHLCFSLTREYFNVEWGDVYKLILPCALIILVLSFIIALTGLPGWV